MQLLINQGDFCRKSCITKVDDPNLYSEKSKRMMRMRNPNSEGALENNDK